MMKCMFWKCSILAAALGLMMALGAFAEGTIGLVSAAACTLGAVYLIRWFWAMEQRAEHKAARRRRSGPVAPRSAPVRQPSASRPPKSLQAAS